MEGLETDRGIQGEALQVIDLRFDWVRGEGQREEEKREGEGEEGKIKKKKYWVSQENL